MTQSMTGFANSIVEIPINEKEKLSLSMHLKSLNSRYFETTCKLPYLLNNLEVPIHRMLKKKLERGHVYLTIKIQHDETKHVVIPSLPAIQGYLRAINVIQEACNIKEEVSLSTLLQLPNILHTEESSLSSATEENVIKALEKLADNLILTRQEEGLVLEHDIVLHMKEVEHKLAIIQTSSHLLITEKKKALESIIEKLQATSSETLSIDNCLIENQKITLLSELEKIDIHEEIVRAGSHIKSMKTLLKEDATSKGKKLDFTLQELNREINTIASKCSNASISSLTIDIKTDLEKAREQSQNIL